MIAALMLFAATAGHVVVADDRSGVVQATKPLKVGDTLAVRRLEPMPGAPGRAPFFRWANAGKVTVTAVRNDGTAEVALVRGKFAPGDKIAAE